MTLHKKAELFDLIKRDPGEMGFIVDSKTYDDYIKTYTDAGFTKDIVVYSEDEFNALKQGFGGRK